MMRERDSMMQWRGPWAMDKRHGGPEPPVRAVIAAVVAWNLAWKGASLWRAARNGQKRWFTTLLLSNTMGVLDAIYIFGVDRRVRRTAVEEAAILAATHEPEQLGHPQET